MLRASHGACAAQPAAGRRARSSLGLARQPPPRAMRSTFLGSRLAAAGYGGLRCRGRHGVRAGQRSAAIGPFGGPRILVTPELGDALGRLQHGETGFDFAGAPVQFSGLQQDMHNVLRDMQDSPIGAQANQLEAMTIELVAMLFDFIFETKDLPDSIKALVGRLQIPVLKAAMLDGAFFSKKSHPSRLLVNALAQAGIGWSPTMGHDDPLYRKIETHRPSRARRFRRRHRAVRHAARGPRDLPRDRGKDRRGQHPVDARRRSTSAIGCEIAQMVARSEIERRLKDHAAPNFLASFLRDKWQDTLAQLYLQEGEESEAWNSALSTLDDLVWSVQPKRAIDDRKKLVAMLRNLLRRLHGGLHNVDVGAGRARTVHVQPGRGARRRGEVEPGLGADADDRRGRRPLRPRPTKRPPRATSRRRPRRARSRWPWRPRRHRRRPSRKPEVLQDRFAEIAGSLERGMWVEFEGDDGQLAFAKLAWVSPLRGTYLFTNRQGQKAVSLTADELARAFPQRSRAPGRGRAAGRSRLHQHDGDDRGEIRRRGRRRSAG